MDVGVTLFHFLEFDIFPGSGPKNSYKIKKNGLRIDCSRGVTYIDFPLQNFL